MLLPLEKSAEKKQFLYDQQKLTRMQLMDFAAGFR